MLALVIAVVFVSLAARIVNYPSQNAYREVGLPLTAVRDAERLAFYDGAGRQLDLWQWKDGVWQTSTHAQIVSRQTVQQLLRGLSHPLIPREMKDLQLSGLKPSKGKLEIQCRNGCKYSVSIGYPSAEVQGTLVKLEGDFPVVAGPVILSQILEQGSRRLFYNGLLPVAPESITEVRMKDEKLTSVFTKSILSDANSKKDREVWLWAGREAGGETFRGYARPGILPELIKELSVIQTGEVVDDVSKLAKAKHRSTSIVIYSSDSWEPYRLELSVSGKQVWANRGQAGAVAVPADKAVDFGRLQFELGDRRILPVEKAEFARLEIRLKENVLVFISNGIHWSGFRSGKAISRIPVADPQTQQEFVNATVAEFVRRVLSAQWPVPSQKLGKQKADLDLSLQFFATSKDSPLVLGLKFFPGDVLEASLPTGRKVVLSGQSVHELRDQLNKVLNLRVGSER